MATKVTWLGHAAFQIETNGTTLLIDPFISGQPQPPCSPDELKADYILISHGHADHVGDAVAIAQRTGATVIANFEITDYFQKQGITKVHPQHIGGAFQHPFGRVKLTIAHHGSGLPDGSYGGNPAGFLLYLPEGNVYFAGDTGLTLDMQLIGEEGIKLALLPIGDNFTMGPDDALRAVKLLKPQRVVPMHYNTWPLIEQDPNAWADRVRAETSAEPVVLKPGESVEL